MKTTWEPKNLFFRQVNPNHINEETKLPNSIAFMPMPKDKDCLSVDDALLTTAEKSWSHYAQTLGFFSVGTWGVSMEEIEEAGDLEVYPDELKNNKAHCVIDFSKLAGKGQKKRKAQFLARKPLRADVSLPPIPVKPECLSWFREEMGEEAGLYLTLV
jgi:hypothetical protein